MKKILAVLLSTSIMMGGVSPAMAYEHDKHDQHDQHDRDQHNQNNPHDRDQHSRDWHPPVHDRFAYDHHDRDDHRHRNDGWGVALGIFGVGAALAIADNAQPNYYVQPQPVYVAPQPVYVQRTSYVPVTVQRTVYEPRTVYQTEYRPVTNYAEVY